VGVAGRHHHDLVKGGFFLTQISFVHDDLLDEAKFSESVELVEEDPQLL